MTLKALRHSHICNGKTEDKPIKPKPKARSVADKPIENQEIKTIPPTRMKEVASHSEPIEVKTKAKPTVMKEEPPPPPRQPIARDLVEASYAEIRRAKQQEKWTKSIVLNQKSFLVVNTMLILILLII